MIFDKYTKKERTLNKEYRKECSSLHQESQSNITLYSNIPVIDVKKYGEYVYLLDEKVMSPGVFNIGIIGNFGAGKSSLLKTYQNQFWYSNCIIRRRKAKQYITISLANFQDCNDALNYGATETNEIKQEALSNKPNEQSIEKRLPPKGGNGNIKDINSSLEKGILEQLLFKVGKSKLPSSRISRIRPNFWPSIFFTFFVIASITSTILAILDLYKVMRIDDENSCFLIYFIIAIVSFAISFFLIFYNSRIRRISIKNFEVELSKQSEESILNLFIDEIIYFFKRTKTKVVVFEDIERFKSIQIFSKLRELNTLINNSRIVRQKVTFIYAINETIIKEKEERAKFFDFILTIHPLVDSINSSDVIGGFFTARDNSCLKSNALSERAIEDFSYYLTDMRIINNTINDYSLLLSKNKENDCSERDQLFAIAMYKNLCPQDYQEFRFGKGILWGYLFQKRDDAILNINKKCTDEISKINNKIEELSIRQASNLENAKMILTGYLWKNGSIINSLKSLSNYIDVNTVNSFDESHEGYYIVVPQTDYYGRPINQYRYANKTSVLSFLKINTIEELNYLFVDTRKKQNELSESRKKLNEKIYSLRQKSINQLISENSSIFEFGKSFESDFIKFLLINNYVDERCIKYFTDNRNGFLSESDSIFISKVLNGESGDYSFKLSNLYSIVNRIHQDRFLSPSILNFDLINYIFNNADNNVTKCSNILTMLSNYPNEAVLFIKQYLNSNLYSDAFIKGCLTKDILNYSEILDDGEIDDTAKEYLLTTLFKCVPDFSDNKGYVKNYFETKKSLSNLLNQKDVSLCKSISEFIISNNVKIHDLATISDIDSSIFDRICENGCFDVNCTNLRYLLDRYVSKESLLNIYNIRRIPNQGILNHINDLEKLMNVLSNGNEKTFSEDDAVLNEILVNPNIKSEVKLQYLNKLTNKVGFSDNLNEEFYKLLLSNNKVNATVEVIGKLVEAFPNLKDDIENYILSDSGTSIIDDPSFANIISYFKDNEMLMIKAIATNRGLIDTVDFINETFIADLVRNNTKKLEDDSLLTLVGMANLVPTSEKINISNYFAYEEVYKELERRNLYTIRKGRKYYTVLKI